MAPNEQEGAAAASPQRETGHAPAATPAAAAPAAAADTLFAAYLAQGRPVVFAASKFKPGDVETGRAILDAPAEVQAACMALAIRQVVETEALSGIERVHGFRILLAAQALAGRLAARHLPYTPAQIEVLLGMWAQHLGTLAVWLPLHSCLRAIAARPAADRLTPTARANPE
jgi:hypothetical protein